MSQDEDQSKKLQELLKLLALQKNKAGLSKQQEKEFEEYKFWKTQPVSRFDEKIASEGPIDSSKKPEDIPDAPLPLLNDFEWCTVDITDPAQLEDVFVLLNENYVEDQDATFRFNYSREFFNWSLKPPGWKKEWHVGVRIRQTKRLVAFISAAPATLRVRKREFKSVEINFLCIHKKLRSKRLAPVLIKEITRRVNKHDIWQALHTGGVLLPSPVSTCRYAHRPLNWAKLHDVGFTGLPANATKTQMIAKYTLPKHTTTPGLRPMQEEDLDAVLALFNKYQERFDLVQIFTKEEFRHSFLNTDNVVYAYVAETNGEISDFVSFYSLPFTVLDNPLYNELGIGYLFYYASNADFQEGDRFSREATSKLKKRITTLMADVCILARDLKMDVFNALSSQDNTLFLEDLKFGPGDGFLNFYLFNYRTIPIAGGLNEDKDFDPEGRSNVGVVML
ncbi:LAMI_0E14642g1_1 [Lachancea mirantina]|uniref:Glycylpeptide N-tetradecanoyltransferase n=1 Tax=Lachancea mirantina TaxID=1230905 RepID=A0A1G4JRT3_9SACH|nr:LAMI_0E14642g1_1 [Lachancea mirantina]